VGYVVLTALIPDSVSILDDVALGPSSQSERERGDRWLREQPSAVLRARSAVVPAEFNYLLNPAHPAFPTIRIESVEPFVFDARLFGG
jgi:RES domain-containing protein